MFLVHVGPLLDTVKVFESLVKCATPVNFVGLDILHQDPLRVAGWHWHLSRSNIVPIKLDFREERMLFNFVSVSLREADTLGGISFKENLQQAYGFVAEVRLHQNWLFNDIAKHLLAVSVVVGRSSAKHLVEKGTQTPPVGST